MYIPEKYRDVWNARLLKYGKEIYNFGEVAILECQVGAEGNDRQIKLSFKSIRSAEPLLDWIGSHQLATLELKKWTRNMDGILFNVKSYLVLEVLINSFHVDYEAAAKSSTPDIPHYRIGVTYNEIENIHLTKLLKTKKKTPRVEGLYRLESGREGFIPALSRSESRGTTGSWERSAHERCRGK